MAGRKLTEWKIGRSNGGHVRARSREIRGEDIAVLAKAVAWSWVTTTTSNARVTRCDNNRDTLHAKLHDFTALAALIGNWEIGLGGSIRDRDHIGWLIDAALKLALVAALIWVRIGRIERRDGIAVRSIDGIQKGVQEALEGVVILIDVVVCLEENSILRPDDGVRDLEIKIRFRPCVLSRCRRSGTVDALQGRMSAGRDVPIEDSVRVEFRLKGAGNQLRGQILEEVIKILLSINVPDALEDAKLVALGGCPSVGNVVETC